MIVVNDNNITTFYLWKMEGGCIVCVCVCVCVEKKSCYIEKIVY